MMQNLQSQPAFWQLWRPFFLTIGSCGGRCWQIQIYCKCNCNCLHRGSNGLPGLVIYDLAVWRVLPGSDIGDDMDECDDNDTVEWLLDTVEVEHSDTERRLDSAWCTADSCSRRLFRYLCSRDSCSLYTLCFRSLSSRFCNNTNIDIPIREYTNNNFWHTYIHSANIVRFRETTSQIVFNLGLPG